MTGSGFGFSGWQKLGSAQVERRQDACGPAGPHSPLKVLSIKNLTEKVQAGLQEPRKIANNKV